MSEPIQSVKLYGGRITVDFNPNNHRYYVNGANPDGVSTIAKAASPFQGDDWAGRLNVGFVRKGFLAALESPTGLMEPSAFLALCDEAETYHQAFRNAAGDSGTAVHDLIEKHLMGTPYEIPDDENVIRGFKAFESWLEQTDVEMVETERMIFSEKYFYCGRTDLLARRRQALLVGDFKTGSGIYPDVAYQVAGYGVAIEEETGDKIEDGLAIHLDKKTGRFKEYWFKLDDEMKGAWKAAVIHYKNLKRVRKTVKEMTDGKRAA